MSLTAITFILAFTISLILALARHPIYGLYAYMLAFYGYPPGSWWGSALPDLRWILIAAAVTFIAVMRRERDPEQPPWYANPGVWLLMAFTLWLWIQQFWALVPATHQYFAIAYTKFVIFFYLMYRVIDDEEAVYKFFLAHVIGCAYFGWLAYNAKGGGRIGNIAGPNMEGTSAFAAHLTTGLLFAGALLFRAGWRVRICIVLAAALILNGIILTQTRGAFLGMMAGGLAVLYLAPRAKRTMFYGASVLAVVLFLMLANDVFWKRMGTIVNAVEQSEDMDGSAEARWVLIDAQWKMFRQSPMLGTGHRGTTVLAPRYLDEKWLVSSGGRASHNTFMSLIVEQGIIGTTIYVLIILWVALKLRWLKKADRLGSPSSLGLYRAALGGAFVSLFVAGQFADFLRLEITVWCLALLGIVLHLTEAAVRDSARQTSAAAGAGTAVGEMAADNR